VKENQLKSPQHDSIRILLRVGGPIVASLGLVLIAIGIGSFFSSFGSFGPPRFIWCAFLGMPLFFVGAVMTKFGYMGAVYRYMASETAPVAKDAVNYMGEGVQPGVKSVAKAVTEGIIEAQQAPKSNADASEQQAN